MSNSATNPIILRGMREQLIIRSMRLVSGETRLGWKVGFGAPSSLQMLGLDAPLVGYLTTRTLLESGAEASLSGWIRPIAEPEIAVYIGRELSGPVNRRTARAAVSAVGPAIELADVHFPPQDIEAILRANIFHRHVILGAKDVTRAGCDLEGLVGTIYHNEDKVAQVEDSQAMTGDIVDIIRLVAETLAPFEETLLPGDLIITGSIIPPISVAAGDEVRFGLGPLEEISVRIAA